MIFTFCHSLVIAQDSTRTQEPIVNYDSLRISKVEFDSIAKYYAYRITANDTSFSATDYIKMVRLLNTISFGRQQSESSAAFKTMFNGELLTRCVITLKMTTYRHGTYYSKHYNIYLGAGPDSNSQYDVY